MKKKFKFPILWTEIIFFIIAIICKPSCICKPSWLISANIIFFSYPFLKLLWEQNYRFKKASLVIIFYIFRILSYFLLILFISQLQLYFKCLFEVKAGIAAILFIYAWQLLNV